MSNWDFWISFWGAKENTAVFNLVTQNLVGFSGWASKSLYVRQCAKIGTQDTQFITTVFPD